MTQMFVRLFSWEHDSPTITHAAGDMYEYNIYVVRQGSRLFVKCRSNFGYPNYIKYHYLYSYWQIAAIVIYYIL